MTPLPIDSFLPQITQALAERGVLVLVAEPGAGKTTRVPPAILRANILTAEHPQLVMLQPRRVAARASAARIAEETGATLGGDVGYHVRFDKKLSDSTRIRVLTEGILTRQLVSDPFLDRVGCVVLDEFHERSLDVDLAIAFLREIRQSVRPDLKLLVMSATLDAQSVARFLGDAPIIDVPGRTFPVEIEHRRPSEKKVWERVADEVEQSIAGDQHGDILVFLPGAHEIQRSQESLASIAHRLDLDVRPLHGSLSFDEQQRALSPSDRTRVILATNIAETSLTIDGVMTVIDSGLARVPRFDAKKGLDRLELTRISQASAKQRAGRAGRTRAGRCVRLWTSNEQAAMDAFELPEIRRVDLAPTVLSLRAWGTSDPRTFGWFDPPDESTLAQAERLLAMLETIDGGQGGIAERGAITELGKQLARLPVHPRIGRMLLAGVEFNEVEAACAYAAILSEKDFVRDDDAYANRSPRTIGASDLEWRMQLLESNGHEHFVDRNGVRSVRRVRDELLRIARRLKPTKTLARTDTDHRLILPLLGFPDRVCKRRENDISLGLMVGGGGVRLHPSSVVREGAFFLALDARSDERSRSREASVRIASRVDSEWLETILDHQITREATLAFEEATGKVVSIRRTRFHDLPIREIREGGNIDPEQAGEVLAIALRGRAKELIEADETSAALLHRLAFVRQHVAEVDWPHIDEDGLNQILAQACIGKRSRGDVRIIDGLRAALPYPLDRKLDQFAPESIAVPTGSNIALDYSNMNGPPVLAVRLQELFGLPETPRIAGGRVAVVLHLLGPNYRPVQVTNDLASFWKNTYPQVRKDLRARYPKHSWPDDPLTADAIRGPRKRGS